MTENVEKIANFIGQGYELACTWEDVTEDGKIKLREWPELLRESSDLLRAAREIQGIELHSFSSIDVAQLAELAVSLPNKIIEFDFNDAQNVLNMAVNAAQIIERRKSRRLTKN